MAAAIRKMQWQNAEVPNQSCHRCRAAPCRSPCRECTCSMRILCWHRDPSVNRPPAEADGVTVMVAAVAGNRSAAGKRRRRDAERRGANVTLPRRAGGFASLEMRDATEDGDELGLTPDPGLREDGGELAARRRQLDAE